MPNKSLSIEHKDNGTIAKLENLCKFAAQYFLWSIATLHISSIAV